MLIKHLMPIMMELKLIVQKYVMKAIIFIVWNMNVQMNIVN